MSNKQEILKFLCQQKGIDFNNYRNSVVMQQIDKRVKETNCKDLVEYKELLESDVEEQAILIEDLTINFSQFFRNGLEFELLANIIIPAIIRDKNKGMAKTLRIWSAGCSRGEEPYSVAIILNEIFEKDEFNLTCSIFATDVDEKVLNFAKIAKYPFENISNTSGYLIAKYFNQNDSTYELKETIKKMVSFSKHDLQNEKKNIPTESVFGGFDLILCRNVLMYFNNDVKEFIFNKLYSAIENGGYIFLGEAESIPTKFQEKFIRESRFCRIFRKL